jgi:cyclic pyranopterin phosphate synthase
VNVSLDTLDPERFRAVTRWGRYEKVMAGIEAAKRAGLQVKINAVALKGVNEDELDRMVAWCGAEGFDLTLIETMPLGEVDGDRTEQYLPLSLARARSPSAGRSTTSTTGRRPGPLRPRARDRAAGSASSHR